MPDSEKNSVKTVMPFDENLLERTRTQWQFGDWKSLAKINLETIKHHPNRANLALLGAAGRLQNGQNEEARQYILLALDWGAQKHIVSQILIAGVHNSIGRIAAIGRQFSRAKQHFESAIAIGTPGAATKLLTQARLEEQLRQLGQPDPAGCLIYLNRKFDCRTESFRTKIEIHFIIHNNHIGGAEYVHFNHALALRELGFSIKIWSIGKGVTYEKFLNSGFSITHAPNLPNRNSNDWIYFEKNVADGSYIYNCNAYNDEIFKNFYRKKSFYYLTILHSDVDWIIQHQCKNESFVHKFICIHEDIKNALIMSGVNVKKISIVNNTLEQDFPYGKDLENNLMLRKYYRISSQQVVVGFVGRIGLDKNCLDLIDVFDAVLKKSDNFKFIIIGGKSSRGQDNGYEDIFFKKLKSSINKERIIYVGEKTGYDLYSHLDLFDIAINVSPSEGLPISMLEQLAKGVYCIYPGFAEISRVLSQFESLTIDVKQRKTSENLRYTDDEKNSFADAILNTQAKDLHASKCNNPVLAEKFFSFKNSAIQLYDAFWS